MVAAAGFVVVGGRRGGTVAAGAAAVPAVAGAAVLAALGTGVASAEKSQYVCGLSRQTSYFCGAIRFFFHIFSCVQ